MMTGLDMNPDLIKPHLRGKVRFLIVAKSTSRATLPSFDG